MRKHRMGIELMILQACPGADRTAMVHVPIKPGQRVVSELRPGDLDEYGPTTLAIAAELLRSMPVHKAGHGSNRGRS